MVRLTLLSLTLFLLFSAEAHGRRRHRRHHFCFSFGKSSYGRYRHCNHCRSVIPPSYAKRYRHGRSSLYYSWCLHCLMGRRGRWQDICPRCGISLFIRNERPYCPRCYLSFRFRRCRICSAMLLVGIPAYEDGPRRKPEREKKYVPPPKGVDELYVKWMSLGLAQLRSNRYGEAANAFRQAMREKSDCPIAMFYWGVAIGAKGQSYRAGIIIRSALRLNPVLAATPLDGSALFGSKEEFRKVLKKALQRKKEKEEKLFLLVLFSMSKKHKERTKKMAKNLLPLIPEVKVYAANP